jgi:dTDP-4-amino-4,6-dideoxygalactose transaminase
VGTWRAAGSLQESEAAQDAAIVLPLFHQLTEADQDRVIDELTRAAGARA